MPHCTSNFAWYLGKFIAGFTGMLFFYFGFLKEREYKCLCRARMREFMRRRGENTNSCPVDDQADANAKREHETRFMLAGVENVWTWYTRIKEWFLEKDPVMISRTALALSRGLPKNDNDISLLNCVCCMKLHDRKSKLSDSFTSVRRKRSRRHCLFRHCSGTVCPQKFMKRRKKHRCVHLRVSQDVIFDHWKPCNKPKSDTNNVNDTKVHECLNTEQEIANCNTFKNEEKKDIENERKLCNNLGSRPEPVCVCEKPRDYHSPRLSPKKVESNQTFSQCVNQSNISKEVASSNTKCINENIVKAQRKSSDKYSSFKKTQSDTSLNETVITDNSMDSVCHKLRTKCPSVKKKLSGECKSNTRNKQSNVDKTEDIFDNTSFSSRQKCGTKHFTNKHRYNRKNNCTVTDRQNDSTSQKKLLRHCARNCACCSKERSSHQWNTSRKASSSKQHHPYCKLYTNVQKNYCPCDHMKAKKNIHTFAETRPSRYKVQSTHCKEKPTWIIFKNKRSARSRILEESKFDNSSYSYSSSSMLTNITENSLQDDSATCWNPCYKYSRYISSRNPRKYKKCNIGIDSNGLSSSSCLTSSRRCHSWAMLSQNSVYEQQPISSSSCTDISRWKRRNEKRVRTYYSSTSSSCSLTSLTTYRDDYNLENSYTDQITYNALKKNDRIFYGGDDVKLKQRWRPTCREHEKRTIHMNERRVAWDI
ncbi:uncharacterized protein LOC105662065 isoform X2 [Megachile rotundata]|uniref:uncharacterized protein LOC105662065 isoform X2 n=1 Tax=Megachile rotundata TaxID=143995 RepID=UPI000614BD86|nr:PREDICTED: uncharacterized protein LOC105662065 isoform X1 [Megachile rotundata]XP_012137377.1 PREDICTED: uncharacterized protein LOC105662065 isoform X1 [Megachile rotundata]